MSKSFEEIAMDLMFRQAWRDNTARDLRNILRDPSFAEVGSKMRKLCIQANLNWAASRQVKYPSTHKRRLAMMERAYYRMSAAPLPWEVDKDWVNPYSTEYYSACGYEDGLEQSREDARLVAEEYMHELTVRMTLVNTPW